MPVLGNLPGLRGQVTNANEPLFTQRLFLCARKKHRSRSCLPRIRRSAGLVTRSTETGAFCTVGFHCLMLCVVGEHKVAKSTAWTQYKLHFFLPRWWRQLDAKQKEFAQNCDVLPVFRCRRHFDLRQTKYDVAIQCQHCDRKKSRGSQAPARARISAQATAMTVHFTFSSPQFENHEWGNDCERGDWQYPL